MTRSYDGFMGYDIVVYLYLGIMMGEVSWGLIGCLICLAMKWGLRGSRGFGGARCVMINCNEDNRLVLFYWRVVHGSVRVYGDNWLHYEL